MDEFALFKGHRYASVVLDADTRRVLWIGEGLHIPAHRDRPFRLNVTACSGLS